MPFAQRPVTPTEAIELKKLHPEWSPSFDTQCRWSYSNDEKGKQECVLTSNQKKVIGQKALYDCVLLS